MSTRANQSDVLDVRQRLALFHGTSVNAEQALSMSNEEITFDLLIQCGCKAINIVVAALRPMHLKKYGVTEAAQLRRLGFTALYLVDPAFCHDACGAYGAEAVVDAFVTEPGAAVVLAGTEAVTILGIKTKKMLEVCAGAPTEAMSVLSHHSGDVDCLEGVPAVVILDAGLRATQLKQLGFNFAKIVVHTSASKEQVLKLGFRV